MTKKLMMKKTIITKDTENTITTIKNTETKEITLIKTAESLIIMKTRMKMTKKKITQIEMKM